MLSMIHHVTGAGASSSLYRRGVSHMVFHCDVLCCLRSINVTGTVASSSVVALPPGQSVALNLDMKAFAIALTQGQ